MAPTLVVSVLSSTTSPSRITPLYLRANISAGDSIEERKLLAYKNWVVAIIVSSAVISYLTIFCFWLYVRRNSDHRDHTDRAINATASPRLDITELGNNSGEISPPHLSDVDDYQPTARNIDAIMARNAFKGRESEAYKLEREQKHRNRALGVQRSSQGISLPVPVRHLIGQSKMPVSAMTKLKEDHTAPLTPHNQRLPDSKRARRSGLDIDRSTISSSSFIGHANEK